MSDQNVDAPLEVPAGATPGQAEASEATPATPPAQPAAPASRNLFEDPDFNVLQSKWHAERHQLVTETQAERQARLAAERKVQAYEAALQQADPDKAQAAILMAHNAERDAELETLRMEKWNTEVDRWATGLGLDPNSPEVQQAKQEVLQSRSPAAFDRLDARITAQRTANQEVEKLRAELEALKQQVAPTAPAQPDASVSTPAPAQPAPAAPRHPVPPSGGSRPATGLTDAEHEELRALYKEESKPGAKAHIAELEARLYGR